MLLIDRLQAVSKITADYVKLSVTRNGACTVAFISIVMLKVLVQQLNS